MVIHISCTYSCRADLITLTGSAPGVLKPVESCKRRIRPGLAVSAPAARTLPDRQTCPKSVCPTIHQCPQIRPNTTRLTIDTTTQTKTQATSSPSGRLRNRNPRLPIPGATSKAYTRIWTMSVRVCLK